MKIRARWFSAGFLLLLLILRVVYAHNYRIDSDEVQHLHVVWGWTQGMLPYRDFFDNHMPLFHVLSAPIFHLFGVRPDIVIPMRVSMNLLFAFNLWCVWKIASEFFSGKDALIGAGIVALWPPFFFGSLEYRPDNLWTSFWLLSLWLISGATMTRLRAFFIGLAIGAALVVSMKSVLFIGALLLASVLQFCFLPSERDRFFRRYPLALLAGLILPPMLTALYFVAHGAGREFFYCTIQHNLFFRSKLHRTALNVFKSSIAIASGIALSRLISRPGTIPKASSRAAFVFLAAVSYYGVLKLFWSIVTPEDYLPFWPSLGAVIAPLIVHEFLRARWANRITSFLPKALIAGELVAIIFFWPPWLNKTADKIGIVADALRLTSPQEYIIDGKGETIYRRRPVYWVYESITLNRIGQHHITDDLVERLIATKTPVASLRRLPDADETFVKANYLPVGFRLRVLGKVIYSPVTPSDGPPSPIVFEVAIPNRYMIVAEGTPVEGTLDGTPLLGPRELAAGQHRLQLVSGRGRIALIWAQAIERGYQPFRAIKPDNYDDTD